MSERQPYCSYCTSGLCCTKISNFGVTRSGREILKNVNLHIHCGELTALIGQNGVGKSTLFKAILGEIPHTGELDFTDGKNLGIVRPVIGYVPQKLDFDNASPMSVLDLFAAAHSRRPVCFFHAKSIRRHVVESLAQVQAEHLMERRLGDLSGGELQRVLLALALDPVPQLLLLDEPVSGIDQNGLVLFYQIVSRLRKNFDLSIILISHNLKLVAEYADRVAFMNQGTIECYGTPNAVFNHSDVVEAFGAGWAAELPDNEEGGRHIARMV